MSFEEVKVTIVVAGSVTLEVASIEDVVVNGVADGSSLDIVFSLHVIDVSIVVTIVETTSVGTVVLLSLRHLESLSNAQLVIVFM